MKPELKKQLVIGSIALAAGAIVLSLTSCSYPTRNFPLEVPLTKAPYRYARLVHPPLGDTLVIVTASGGGTRATALAMAVLKRMQDVKLPAGDRLSDEVDIISSVSGGSVAAADFALYGTKGFDDLEHNFIRHDGIGALAWRFFNPVGLVETSTNSRERIDALIDYLDSSLFRHSTMAAMLDGKPHPYLILNAGDMVEGTPFAMTQDNFDLLCSDLSKTEISTAVAASAAFPVALSPVTLTNYSPCAMQRRHWPPVWIDNATHSDWSQNAEYVTRGRVAAAYAAGNSGDHPKKYVHLLDGGIADNLGVMEPYRMLATTETDPSFLNHFESGEIKKLIFILINARSAASSSLDASQATPGVLDMLLGTVDAGIDRTTMGNKERLRELLKEAFVNQAHADAQMGEADSAKNLNDAANNMFLVSVDFDAIPQPGCRQAFHSIPTSWKLKPEQIDAILKMGPALLNQDPDFARAMRAIGGRTEGRPPSVDEACISLHAKL